jgi:predicted DNA-binding ArsR family transcriptional regulator
VASQITALQKILEQSYDPNKEPHVYCKSVQDASNSLESLNEIINESTLIRHGLNQFKEHIDLKADIKAWKKLARTAKTWKKIQITIQKINRGGPT